MFLDIGAEELSHMEMVAQTINLLNGHDVNYEAVGVGGIEPHVTNGLSPVLANSSGYSWTADYVTVTGDLVADLLANIASEQRAKVVYEYLYHQIEDKYVRETIDFLLSKEETHNALFREALNKVQASGSNKDFGVTEDSKLYFDLSTPMKRQTQHRFLLKIQEENSSNYYKKSQYIFVYCDFLFRIIYIVLVS